MNWIAFGDTVKFHISSFKKQLKQIKAILITLRSMQLTQTFANNLVCLRWTSICQVVSDAQQGDKAVTFPAALSYLIQIIPFPHWITWGQPSLLPSLQDKWLRPELLDSQQEHISTLPLPPAFHWELPRFLLHHFLIKLSEPSEWEDDLNVCNKHHGKTEGKRWISN